MRHRNLCGSPGAPRGWRHVPADGGTFVTIQGFKPFLLGSKVELHCSPRKAQPRVSVPFPFHFTNIKTAAETQ